MKKGRVGLYPLRVIASFLGQRFEEMKDRVELDLMPVINVPAKTKPMQKVSLLAFHGWLSGRSSGAALTVEQLKVELDACADALSEKLKKAEKETA